MGLLNSRKKNLLGASAVVVFVLFCLVFSSTRSLNQDTSLKVASGLEGGVQIPNSGARQGSDDHKVTENQKEVIKTKKMTNGNNLVKSKEGLIDESKVMEAENQAGNSKIPLKAGDPTSNKKNLEKEKESELTKELGTTNNKITDKEETDSKLASSSVSKGTTNNYQADTSLKSEEKTVKSSNRNVMDAQKKAEKEGVSKDTGSSFDVKNEYEKILSKSPVVIFSKSYCPFSKKLKHLLNTQYQITPEPHIVELDNHEYGEELQKHIHKETGRFTVPNFMVSGSSKGGSDDILALHDNNELVDLFHSWSGGAAKIQKLTPAK